MKRSILLISCLLVFVLGCNLMPTGDAIVFDIGEKMESDIGYNYRPFTSGAYIRASKHEVNLSSLVYDGNLSTGINQIVNDNALNLKMMFIQPLYVRNITIKPIFGGGSSTYNFDIIMVGNYCQIFSNVAGERFLKINGYIDGVSIVIFPIGANQYNFNDVIINYTSIPSNSTGLLKEINELRNLIHSFQNQINNFTNQFNLLNNMITNLNTTINKMNYTQKQILENITNLWAYHNRLNESINNLYQLIDNFNSSMYQNITQIENNLNLLEIDINNIWHGLENLSINVTELPKIQQQINMIYLDIDNLNENITLIKNSIPPEIDETTLSSRIFLLESENQILQRDIENKTQLMDRLSLEIENHTTEIEKLTSELDELKQTEKEKIIEKEADNTLSYSAILLGILGIVIAIGAIGLLFKKLGQPPELTKKEEPEITPIPEQHIIDYTGQTSQEQSQVAQEVQNPEAIQVQQEQGVG